MFPDEIVEDYIEDYEETNTTTFNGKTFLFDFAKGDFVYKNGSPVVVEGIKAIQVWIEKVIRTQKFKFNIYDGVEYGVNIDDLIGSSLPKGFIESEIERELSEAILVNPYVEELTGWNFTVDGSEWIVSFTVVTVSDETFEMEVAA